MANFFFRLGNLIGPRVRQANWVVRSLTGTEAEAVGAEVAMGRDLAAALLQQLPPDPDPAVCRLLDECGGRLAAGLRQAAWRFRFLPVLAAEPNAFALPGGYVFVTRSLLRTCVSTPDDLAFVLGHEMGHVVRRHALDRMMASTLVGGLVHRIPGAAASPRVAAALRTLVDQGYSQDQELQADVTALQLARAAGYDPASALGVLRRLGAGITADSGPSAYFSSHPPLPVRIRQVERWLRTPRRR